MPYCICASAYRPFTTSSRIHEDRIHEKPMGATRTQGCGDCHASCSNRQCGRDEPMELADTGRLWWTDDHLWASVGSAGLEPDSVRRMAWAVRSSPALASAAEGAVGAHEPGGARAVPPRPARALWPAAEADDRTAGRTGVNAERASGP